jgi:hypothetical protein
MGVGSSTEDHKGSGDNLDPAAAATVVTDATEDKFEGALLGIALGDFLGFLVEGEDRAGCAKFAKHVAAHFQKGPFHFTATILT